METEGLIHRPFFSRASRIFDRLTSSVSERTNVDLTAVSGSGSGSGSGQFLSSSDVSLRSRHLIVYCILLGLPGLMQRTVARQVELSCPVGAGRFGEV